MAEIKSDIYFQQQAPDLVGGMAKGMSMKQLALDNQNKKQEMDYQGQLRQYDMMARLASGVKDQTSYDSAMAEANRLGLDVSQMPRAYDKGVVNSILNRSVSYLDKLKNDREQYKLYLEEKAAGLKAEELSSAQAKQLGNFQLGQAAEDQYKNAVSTDGTDSLLNGKYDPTSSGQWIDNSEWAPNWMKNKKAVEAHAAQANWIETYLRDASGAAIPPSERMAYAKDYFPQPGDTPDVVANKERLRQQKMENSLIGSGPKGQRLISEMKKKQAPKYEQDVIKYAQDHNISPEQAQKIKNQRLSETQTAGR